MKIKQKRADWKTVLSMPKIPHHKPQRPLFLLQLLIWILSLPTLWTCRFSFRKERMEEAGEGPYLILMNHSSFLDLKMAARILFPMKYAIVSTTDAFVGKSLLMRFIGCMATQKFVTDVNLVLDMIRMIKKQKCSILMFPEAGYTLDGTATRLPARLGGMLKRLGVPVLMIRSDEGGFLRDPLYNGLRLRKVRVSATLSCLFTREELNSASVEELDLALQKAFAMDHFAAQQEKKISVSEPFRATGLERVLYRCPACGAEGTMVGEGIHLTCRSCKKVYELTEYGALQALSGETEFSLVSDWFSWQRKEVRRELEEGRYRVELPVEIGVIADHKCLYRMGKGTLVQDRSGITLTSEDGSLSYRQDPYSSYSLNVDFFWYEIGDVIGIGNKERLFYCFPQVPFPVAKARLAAEELYEMPKIKGDSPAI